MERAEPFDQRPKARFPVLLFLVAGLGAFLASMDVSLPNTLLGSIGASTGITQPAVLAWVLTSYAIVFAAALVPGGRLADYLGRRRGYATGLIVLACGSVLCGAAPNFGTLVAGRAAQALGAAVSAPASLGLLLERTPASSRSVWSARWAGAGALGIAVGPLLGGALTATLSWRWAFFVNVAVIAVTLTGLGALPSPAADRTRQARLPDPFGSVIMAAAAGAFTLALSQTGTWGLTDRRTVAALACGAALSIGFVFRSKVAASPVLDMTLFRIRSVSASAGATFFYSCAFFGLIYSFVAFLHTVWHLSLVGAGLAILPIPLTVAILTIVVGTLSDRFGFRMIITAGVLVMGIGLLLSSLMVFQSSFSWWWLLAMAVVGLGSGLSFPVLSAASVAGLDNAKLAAASAINQCARQIGAAFGIAVTVSVVKGLGSGSSGLAAGYRGAWIVGAAFCAVSACWAIRIRSAMRNQQAGRVREASQT